MSPSENSAGTAAGSSPRWFAATHWSVVLAAKDAASPDATQAMEKLCRAYWPPLYAYIRRAGHNATEAQDLTQDFFALDAQDLLDLRNVQFFDQVEAANACARDQKFPQGPTGRSDCGWPSKALRDR